MNIKLRFTANVTSYDDVNDTALSTSLNEKSAESKYVFTIDTLNKLVENSSVQTC